MRGPNVSERPACCDSRRVYRYPALKKGGARGAPRSFPAREGGRGRQLWMMTRPDVWAACGGDRGCYKREGAQRGLKCVSVRGGRGEEGQRGLMGVGAAARQIVVARRRRRAAARMMARRAPRMDAWKPEAETTPTARARARGPWESSFWTHFGETEARGPGRRRGVWRAGGAGAKTVARGDERRRGRGMGGAWRSISDGSRGARGRTGLEGPGASFLGVSEGFGKVRGLRSHGRRRRSFCAAAAAGGARGVGGGGRDRRF